MTQSSALQVLKNGQNVFLTGEPGAGKTHTINEFTAYLRDIGKPYAITASTGIAATHVGGTTIHSFSGIKMKRKINQNNLGDMESDRFVVERLQRPGVLIIDEVSMLDSNFMDMLDIILRHFRDGTKPFGGIQMVFVGDFFQLPPVSKGTRPRMAFESQAWHDANLTVCYLTEQHRTDDPEFLAILKAMRDGTLTPVHKERIAHAKMETPPRTHLFTHNSDVDFMNDEELAKLPGKQYEYKMVTSGIHAYPIDILKKQILSPEILKLKVGAPVMFTRNHKEGQYANGTIGTVLDFNGEYSTPRIRLKDGRLITPKRETWTLEENGKERAKASQYPLKLAWAITVHKSQGMSLDEATIDLSKCFEFGQGYVALSRVRTLAGMHIEGISENAFAMSPKVIKHDKTLRQLSA